MSRNGARPAGRGRALKGKRRKPGDGLETGLETAADGTVIGQDPRSLTPPELRELGHRGKPLLQAMRRRCVDCCSGKADEVRRCTAVACPLWPYRMGTDPWHAEPVRPVVRGEPAVPPAAPVAPVARAAPTRHAAPAEPARAAADGAAAAPSLAAEPTAATSEPPAEPQKPAPTAPARRRRPVAQVPEPAPAPEPARGSAPAPAPQAPPPPHTTGKRRSRRPAEAPLLPFLDDAPA